MDSTQEELEEYAKTKRWGLEIGIETDSYDGVSIYLCPHCNHTWKRFPWVSDADLQDCAKMYGSGLHIST